jgi:hypothetical protein
MCCIGSGGIPVESRCSTRPRGHEVLGLRMPVLPPTPIVIAKLQSLTEHYCDFAPLLLVVRAVREQLDWAEIRRATRDQPFPEAFLAPGRTPRNHHDAISQSGCTEGHGASPLV